MKVINDILPVKARKEVDRLIAELQDGQFKLEFAPSTTIEFVNSLTFLDEIQERVCLCKKEMIMM
jgi:dynein heavy chain